MSSSQRVEFMLVPLPLVVGALFGVVIGLVSGSWLWAVVSFVVLAAVIAAVAYIAADPVALRLLGARPLAEAGAIVLRNQLEELCARTGVAEPELYTVGPGAPAIASVGRSTPALVVTDGLVNDLTVVELEAVVARELARAKNGSTTIDTLAVTFITVPFGLLGGLGNKLLGAVRGVDHDARIDLDGIGITRYPPGMSAALSKMATAPGNGARAVSHLWAVADHDLPTSSATFGIEERLALLAEL